MRRWCTRTALVTFPVFVLLALAASPSPARADVTRVEVKARTPIADAGYEKIAGLVYFAVNPRTAGNSVIADLEKTATTHDGRVEFSADFYILRPLDASRSNRVALVDVVNRGRKMVLSGFNRGGTSDPATAADLGDGFLMRQGFTVAWVGWEFDVRRSADVDRGAGMGIAVPTARGVSDVVRASFTPNDDGPQTVGDLAGYRPLDANARDTTLSVRDGELGTRQPIARERYTVRGNVVTLIGGFEKGRTYELIYRPTEWPVAGLGLAAYRDFTSWLRHAPDSLAPVDHTIGFGSSQSGRFLRTFFYYGFNADEQGRRVLDGAMVHIAGAAQLSLNQRGAQPTSLTMYAATQFPYATAAERDPVTRRVDGLFENGRAAKTQPKVMFTNTAVEYWGGGRAAALIHTTADGKRDLTLPPNVRAYFLTGAQHGPAPFPAPPETAGQQAPNPLEYWWTMRALLVAMTDWVTRGVEPPASQVPRLSDGSLVTVAKLKFPALPGVANPRTVQGPRAENHDLPFLVPQVDADGNEIAGIRTPEHRVPMATFTGWNFRGAAIGGTAQLVNLLGAAVPFPATKTAGDPRRALDERYPAKDAYLAAASEAADALVKGRYLRRDDVAAVMARVEAWWALIHPAGSR